jgi:DNA polymerase III subunit gamma/tau
MASYQSLYRRYRPQRFDEVLGQDHVTRALRNAVRDGRVGHAYLFSGPRGTGKTSTARILAKVLNCAAPVDGEPCGKCENCVAVADGRVVDWLLEQDAASKSKVDDMRDLLERVPLGTSGNRKVIILDEVHMLSQGAENALLKTLEEPPAHVLFVLATTDPQKVRPTIRSRTQHFEFRLLPPEVLGDLVRHVIADAGLGLGDEDVEAAVDHVLRSGGGSARDTLSALDQVAALGEVVDETEPVDAVVDALCDHDAGQVLVAVADALASGRDPRTLGENVIAALRDAFLSVMGAADDHLAPASRARAALVGDRLGPAGLTRALEVLGEALTELSRKPDPRIVVEVALVRLTQPAADRTLDAVLDRLDRLERRAAAGTGGGVGGAGGGPGDDSGRAAPSGAAPRGAAPSGSGAPADPASSTSPPTGEPRPGARPASGAGGGAGAAAARDALSSARRTGDEPPATGAGPRGRGSGQSTLGSIARGRRRSDDAPTAAAGGGAATATLTGEATDAPAGPSADAARAVGPAVGESGEPASVGSAGAAESAPVDAEVEPAEPDPAGGSAGAAQAPAPARSAGAVPAAAGGSAGAAQAPAPARSAGAVPAAAGGGRAAGPSVRVPDRSEVDAAWSGGVLAGLPVKIRSKWRAGRWIDADRATLQFAVPNAWHQTACDEARRDVEQALAGHFGHPVTVAVVVDGDNVPDAPGSPGAPADPGPGVRPAEADPDEDIDPRELRDAGDVATSGVDLLLREFGGELVEEDT